LVLRFAWEKAAKRPLFFSTSRPNFEKGSILRFFTKAEFLKKPPIIVKY
jgi:hypothetical protein